MSKKAEEDPSSDYKLTTEISVNHSAWFKNDYFVEEGLENYIDKIVGLTLRFLDFFKYVPNAEVSFLLSDDKKLQKLNHDFRAQDKPTNVLSFPAQAIKAGAYKDLNLDIATPIFLGDIAISYSSIYKESIEQYKTFKEHFSHIVVHSILHLLGYDHINDQEAEEMEGLEVAILNFIGFKNPYLSENISENY